MSKKIYILDTNVLVHDPNALFAFEGAQIGIPAIVLEELDRFKTEPTGRGRNTREVIRRVDALRSLGSLQNGVPLDNGGTLRIILLDEKELPKISLDTRREDNIILLNALALKKAGYDVHFITKDLNARVKADALGIVAEDYLKQRITTDTFYKGWFRVPVPSIVLKSDYPTILNTIQKEKDIVVNEFVLLESQHNPHNYRIFRYVGNNKFHKVEMPTFRWPLQPRNAQQLMALDLLLDPTLQLVTLFGHAGTGKTFLALLAALHQVLVSNEYKKILISRPIVPLGRDIGFLPGTLEEKLHNWMLPIFDNMELINHLSVTNAHEQRYQEKRRGRSKKLPKHKQRRNSDGPTQGLMSLEDLVESGKLSMEAITYMRGRSIPYQYIIIDEVQNLTPHEVKTLISRVGEGSKIVLTGDPYQIDSPYLDFSSNGLVVISDRFRGQRLFGTTYLEKSERSELSQLTSELL